MDGGDQLSSLRTLISTVPFGLTPICMQLDHVINSIIKMKEQLVVSKNVTLLLIMTDVESIDGDVAGILKPLERLRMCSDESEVTEYWDDVSAKLYVDTKVIQNLQKKWQRDDGM